ncbi:MAG: sulfite exporter TauE/SafE family protein [Enterocloster sp.]
MEQFLIVCPLVFLAGFVDSIAGGGGLISFPAYMLAGVPVHVILGTSKLSAFPGSIVAALRFAKSGYIRFKLALPWAASAALGAVGGASLALKTDEKLIRSLMVVVLPVVAFYVLKNKELGGGEAPDRSEDPDGFRRMFFTGLAVSFLIGGYDGFYGPGTGTFLILVFTGLLKLGTRDAAGISKVVNLSAVSGPWGRFCRRKGGLCLGIAAALFCMAGSYFGAGLVVNNGQKIVRPVVMGVLALLFVKILAG